MHHDSQYLQLMAGQNFQAVSGTQIAPHSMGKGVVIWMKKLVRGVYVTKRCRVNSDNSPGSDVCNFCTVLIRMTAI